MYLDLVPRQNKISERQLLGDLTSLFARHRIEIGDAHSFDHFYSRLVSNDAFRGRLFALCTAISHMSDEDLSGEQLLELISRALTGSYGLEINGNVKLPDSLRSEFVKGYQAWGARDPSRPPAPLPVPPRQQLRREEPVVAEAAAAASSEAAGPEVRAPDVRASQEAAGSSQSQSSGEEAGRGRAAGKSIEGLTLQELTQLLEDIEQRMRRIRPQVIAAIPAMESKAPLRQPSTSLRASPPPALSVPPIEVFEDTGDLHARESAFLARHAYLRTTRPVVPAISSEIEPAPAAAEPVLRAQIVPIAAPNGHIEEPPSEVVPVPGIASDRLRVKIYLAICVMAAIIFVASPIAGLVVYHVLHPGPKFIYNQNVGPVVSPAADTPATIETPAKPSDPHGISVAGKPVPPRNVPTHPRAGSAERNTHPARRGPAVAVWPPPPR